MVLGCVSWTEIHNRTAESAEQDQTARMCRLILPYTLRKINPRSSREKYKLIIMIKKITFPLLFHVTLLILHNVFSIERDHVSAAGHMSVRNVCINWNDYKNKQTNNRTKLSSNISL